MPASRSALTGAISELASTPGRDSAACRERSSAASAGDDATAGGGTHGDTDADAAPPGEGPAVNTACRDTSTAATACARDAMARDTAAS